MNSRLKILSFSVLILLNCTNNDERGKIFTGVIEGTTVQVPALTGGKLNSILIDTGDEVYRDQIIAQVDTFDLFFEKLRIQGAREEITVQRKIAATQMGTANNNLSYVREKYQRFKDLLQKESISQQTVDDIKNQLEGAEAAYESAQQQVITLNARLKQLEAQLNSINKKISDATIKAPLSGIVSQKYYEAGEAVPPLNPVAEIINLSEVWIKVYISEKMLPHIRIGLEVETRPDGTDRSLKGKISWISPKAEFSPKNILTQETRTSLVYAVKIIIPNEEHILKNGMPVEVHLNFPS